MGWKPKIGDMVKTQFGSGVVQKTSFDKVLVRMLERSLEGYMNIDEIEPLETGKNSTTKGSISSAVKEPSYNAGGIVFSGNRTKSDSHYSRTCIDALRFGLVPDKDLEKLTIGYDSIEKWVMSSFPKFEKKKTKDQSTSKPVVNQIIGQFGDGKSHLMSTIRHIAKKKRYLIARTEVDGNKVSFSNPNTLLYSLWKSLEGDDLSESTPLLDLFCKAIHSGYDMPKITPLNNDRFKKMYYLIKKLDAQGDLENVKFLMNDLLSCNDRVNATEAKKILKEETRLSAWDLNNEVSPMVSRRVEERQYTFIESIIGTALLSIKAGYSGLIILIDEFEVETALLGTNNQKERFKENLNILEKYMVGKTSYPSTSLGIYFATAGKELDFGSKYIDDMVRDSEGDRYEIKPIMDWDLDNPEILGFVKNVYQTYKRAYPQIEASEIDFLNAVDDILQNEQVYESGGIRYFVKQYVGLLDRRYGPPVVYDWPEIEVSI